MSDSENRDLEGGTEIERTIFQRRGLRIATTLLVVNLEVPEIATDSAAAELPRRLLELWPRFLSFFISFWIVGVYWRAHHRTFRYIKRYDRGLLVINLWFLMWVVLMPFSGSLLGEYGGEQISVVLYDSHMIVAGVSLSWL